jgi:hypothetical protein
MLPAIGLLLVHFGHVPAGLVPGLFACQMVWKLAWYRVSTMSAVGPGVWPAYMVCRNSSIVYGSGCRRNGRRDPVAVDADAHAASPSALQVSMGS